MTRNIRKIDKKIEDLDTAPIVSSENGEVFLSMQHEGYNYAVSPHTALDFAVKLVLCAQSALRGDTSTR